MEKETRYQMVTELNISRLFEFANDYKQNSVNFSQKRPTFALIVRLPR